MAFDKTTATGAQRGTRLVELDALRGMAALGVVLFHFTTNYDRMWGHPKALPFYFPPGHLGVELFFVVSGFVIYLTLTKTATVSQFVWNRFSRLYPAYWTACILGYLAVSVFGLPGREVGLPTAIFNLTMAQGFFGLSHIAGPFWTLHVELCFYITMVVLFYAVPQRYRLPLLTVIAVLLVLNTRCLLGSEIPGVWRLATIWPLRQYIQWFLLGILLFQTRHSGWSKVRMISLVACIAVAVYSRSAVVMGERLCVVAIAVIGTQTSIHCLRNPILVWLGTISYSLYLLHANLGYVIIYHGYARGVPGTPLVFTAVVTVVAVAAAVTYLIERPANRYLRSLVSRKQQLSTLNIRSSEQAAGILLPSPSCRRLR